MRKSHVGAIAAKGYLTDIEVHGAPFPLIAVDLGQDCSKPGLDSPEHHNLHRPI
jgi:hypothetical protein